MPSVTFQVLEGIDKGRTFRELPTPVTIGREEGNVLRLNDERVSRFHAKVQSDSGEIILTDLESTNGTRVNGNVVQIRRLRAGDRVGVGRSLLLFGTEAKRSPPATPASDRGRRVHPAAWWTADDLPATVHGQDRRQLVRTRRRFRPQPHRQDHLRQRHAVRRRPAAAAVAAEDDPLAGRPAGGAARFLHHRLTNATENIQANEEGSQVALSFADWQRVLAVQMVLARYVRAVAEPDVLEE